VWLLKAKHGAMYLRMIAVCECGHGDYEHGCPEQWQMSMKQKENAVWKCHHKGCKCENFSKRLDKRLKLGR